MSKAKKKPTPARPRTPSPAKPGRGWRAARPFIVAATTLAAVGGLLFGIGQLGDEAGRRLGPRGRYEVRFEDIDCPSPPGSERGRFLAEVQRVGALPDTFHVVDTGLSERLRAAFSAHPWVESVDAVNVDPGHRVSAGLTFRAPALAVTVLEVPPVVRLVDRRGVLLPRSALPAGLPALRNAVAPPRSADGQPWSDGLVSRAVELTNGYRPRTVEKTPKGWRLELTGGRAILVGW